MSGWLQLSPPAAYTNVLSIFSLMAEICNSEIASAGFVPITVHLVDQSLFWIQEASNLASKVGVWVLEFSPNSPSSLGASGNYTAIRGSKLFLKLFSCWARVQISTIYRQGSLFFCPVNMVCGTTNAWIRV